jgi:GR25 family glycosyltransferase involved in LPS biosynthesis
MGKLNTIFGHKSRVKWKPKTEEPKVLKMSTQTIINNTINQTIHRNKIDVIITSVNYNDFLILSLENNTKYFENITVVTSNDDKICQDICESFGVKCITTDVFYEDGFKFNKGKAINVGIESIINPEFILLLDADIIVTNKIELTNLESDTLYTSDRWICYNHFQYERWRKGETQVNNLPKYERDNGYGFFQLFNFNNSIGINRYNDELENSSHPDLKFSSHFPKKQTIDVDIIHLGYVKKNWDGRKSEKFITDEVFYELKYSNKNYSFDINSYFDKIYCLNLDRRIDRWAKVKSEFNRLNILVERWSAIDGENLEESNYSQLINEKKSSKLGKIENKFAMACLLSHLSIIKDAKNNGFKKILIFEDDVIFSNDFSEKIKIILKLNWKLLYLGSSQFYWHKIDTSEEFYNCHNTLGTFAYAVDISLFDDIINTFEKKTKSVDNLLSEIQSKHKEECFTIYPNIVISDVEDSDIRQSTNMSTFSKSVKWNLNMFKKQIKVLLVPDVRGWAFDNIAKSIIRYNKSNNISYDIAYIKDIEKGDYILDVNSFDYIYVLFEAERLIPDSEKVIRGCYSAFWIEDEKFSAEKLGEYFSNCKASIFANQYLKDSISPYLSDNYPSTIIHDSSDENLFYPIVNIKNDNFTVIFVGNIKRKIKNFKEIEFICKEAEVDLIVCNGIKNDDLVNYYNKADVCINFSTFEGGPQTFIESSLCSVPMLIRKNNELSKLIPCFTGETKEEFVQILKYLKNNRHLCEDMGNKARKVALNDFTYEKTSEKFTRFFLQLEGIEYKENKIKDLSKFLTVFIISCGFNPNYEDCKMSLGNQTVKFKLKEVKNISPMSKAFQKMIDDCDTDYYIQVDEDMILQPDSIETIYNSLTSSGSNISTIAHMLKDTHLDFNLYGIKGYKHNILKEYPYNLEIISCEVEQVKRLQNDGYDTLMVEKVIGYHSPKWTPELIYERYFDVIEKWKIFKYNWMSELPSKLLKIFQNNPTEINLYALMGAMSSLSVEEPIRDREKNFQLKDKNFDRLQKMTQLKQFNHITNRESEKSQILNSNEMFGKK